MPPVHRTGARFRGHLSPAEELAVRVDGIPVDLAAELVAIDAEADGLDRLFAAQAVDAERTARDPSRPPAERAAWHAKAIAHVTNARAGRARR
jgi:hypothetical protein